MDRCHAYRINNMVGLTGSLFSLGFSVRVVETGWCVQFMVFSLSFHSWTCSSLCFYTLLQGRKSLLWKVIRNPLSTDTPKRFINCKKIRHIWFWSKIYRFRPCILLTRKGLKWNINKSHAIKKKAINGSWFTTFGQTTHSNPRGGKVPSHADVLRGSSRVPAPRRTPKNVCVGGHSVQRSFVCINKLLN